MILSYNCISVCRFRSRIQTHLQSLDVRVRFQASAQKSSRTALFWAVTQRVVVIPYRRFGKTFRSHLQGPRITSILENGSLTLEDETGSPETSVKNYHYTLRNTPEERSSLNTVYSLTFIATSVQQLQLSNFMLQTMFALTPCCYFTLYRKTFTKVINF